MNVAVLERPATAAQASARTPAVAADIGYGYVKAISSSGHRAIFPSVVAPATHDPLGGFMEDNLGHRVRVRRLDGSAEERLVGEAAARSAAAVTTLAKNKPADMHDTLLLAAAYLVGAGSASPFPAQQVDLAVGLPLAFYRAQRDTLRARLEALSAWVSMDGGEERYVSFRKVLVLPQGAGVVAAFPELLPEKGLVGVVDVGTYTTDYLLLEKLPGRAEPKPVLECCGSAEVGVHLVHKAVAREFQARTGAPLPPEMWEETARAGSVVYEGRAVDLSAAVERALADAAQAISQRVLGAWGNRAGFVSATILAGGGALLLKERLAACLPCVVEAPDPVFANALGFLRALTG
ncbi:ParM/StbA family protein [Desulfovirgula thermocuniculi]|uniref:ParM/StbA family protein n=1 Tax=Desulfovirgula thermocuniculi TaxID=348842 RepID=UPI000A0518A6|nr:ParM/StbA family protein [Desulfovirgula thermocuniculi]